MGSVPQELQNIIDRRGGLTLPVHPDSWTRHLISQATKAIEIQRRRVEVMYFNAKCVSLHAAVFNSISPSAFAAISLEEKPTKNALIGVSYGYIYNAACLVSLMLGRRDMFLDVGDPSMEKQSSTLSYIPSNLADSDIHPIQPACEVRKAFSVYLLARFIDSVFMHEVSHLIRGHVGLISESGEICWTDGGNAPSSLSALSRQALEFDADTGAVEECCNYFIVLRERIIEGKLFGPDESVTHALKHLNLDVKQAAKYVFASMYLPLRMFEVNHWDHMSQDGLSHPAPPIRMLYLVFIFSSAMVEDELLSITLEQATATAFAWAADCEINYMKLQGQEVDAEGLISAWRSPESKRYIDKIHSEYMRLAPLLEPYVLEFSFSALPYPQLS